jgi:hypothetical protein
VYRGLELRRRFERGAAMDVEGWIGAGGARVGFAARRFGGELDFGRGDETLLAECAATGSRGLADEPCLRWTVDVVDEGDAARDARDSTSSKVWDCQPLLTLTMA